MHEVGKSLLATTQGSDSLIIAVVTAATGNLTCIPRKGLESLHILIWSRVIVRTVKRSTAKYSTVKRSRAFVMQSSAWSSSKNDGQEAGWVDVTPLQQKPCAQRS